MMLTTAAKTGDHYVLRGRKWFITGAADASHFNTLARTSDERIGRLPKPQNLV